jgi:hypothetical protein
MAGTRDDRWVDPEFEQRVRESAYLLWERSGRPLGEEQRFWFQALERCLQDRQDDDRQRRGLVDPM